MTEKTEAKARWRYTRGGAVLLSFDFYLGVPLGLVASLAVGWSDPVRSAAPGLLIGTAAVGAALATLVLTSLTVLLTTLAPEYRSLLRQMPGGISAVATPYRIIIAAAASSAALSLCAAFVIDAVAGKIELGSIDLGALLVSAPALALTAWSALGCVQLSDQFIEHWERSDRATEVERRRRALSRNAS